MPFLKKTIDKVAVRAKILNKNLLKKHKKYIKHTLTEWAERYKDFKWNEIATEAGWDQGQPLVPNKLRHSGKWKNDSWSYDFKRFIETQYKTLFNNYEK
ncbi:MAG: hypothetical protein ACFNZS_11245 [Ottowia sp.]